LRFWQCRSVSGTTQEVTHVGFRVHRFWWTSRTFVVHELKTLTSQLNTCSASHSSNHPPPINRTVLATGKEYKYNVHENADRHCHSDMKSAFQHQNPMTCKLTSKPIPVVKISTTLQRALYRLYRWLATRTLCSLFSLVYLVIHPLDEQHLRTKSNM